MKEFAMYPRPFEDESLLGYVGRLASANGMHFMSVLKELRGTSSGSFKNFNDRLRGPDFWIDSFAEVMKKGVSKYNMVRMTRPRHCPVCLAEHGYWKHIWSYPLYGFCAEHHTQLVDTCHQCHARLDTGSYAGEFCRHCCAQFKNAPYQKATSHLEIQFSEFFKMKVFGATPLEPKVFSDLGAQEFHSLVFSLAALIAKPWGQNEPAHNSVRGEDIPHVCSTAAKLVLLWPQPFIEHLENSRLACNDSWHFARCYNRLHHLLYRKMFTENCNFVRVEFEHYLAQNWVGPLTERSRSLSNDLLRRHPWKSFKEIVRSVKIPPSKLKSLIADGSVPAVTLPHASGKVSTVVRLESVIMASSLLTKVKNLKESSAYLGISDVRLKLLISHELITVSQDHTKRSTPWSIDCESFVARFKLNRLRNDAVEYLTLGRIIGKFLRSERKFIRFMFSLTTGSVELFGRNGDKFCDFLLSAEAFRAWSEKYYSFSDAENDCDASHAAGRLGVKSEVVVQLVNIGLLSNHADKPYHYKIAKADLEAFQAKYVLNTQLARKHLTSPKRISSVLVNHFEPAASPHHETRPCRQYVWYRSDNLEEVLMRSHSAPRPRRARRLVPTEGL